MTAAEVRTEWGVRRTWGPKAGTVAGPMWKSEAVSVAKMWPGELVSRTVVVGDWTAAAPEDGDGR